MPEILRAGSPVYDSEVMIWILRCGVEADVIVKLMNTVKIRLGKLPVCPNDSL